MPVEGGASVEIAKILGENIGGRLSISPDGKFLAYPYRESLPVPATKLAIIPAEGGLADESTERSRRRLGVALVAGQQEPAVQLLAERSL